jgi:putative transposase
MTHPDLSSQPPDPSDPQDSPDPSALEQVMQILSQQGADGMIEAFRILLNQAMKCQRAQAIGAAPYQRTQARQGHANGYKPKTLFTRMGPVTLDIPQARGIAFYPAALEKGVRSERALKLAIAEMYVQGVSTRKVSAIMEQLCGTEVSSSDVSRAATLLDEQLSAWRKRPLGKIVYLILDARYEKVRRNGVVLSCAVLLAIGVDASGRRSIMGVSAALSEAEVHWRDFLASLQERGLHGTALVVSDDHPGLRAAIAARMPGVPWQRCQFHLMQNALHYVPHLKMRTQVAQDLRAVFDAPNRPEAQRLLQMALTKYQEIAPDLARWMENNIPEGLTVLSVPASHRRRPRTANSLERLNREIKRRTAVAGLFPNEASLLRLVTAVTMEIDEDMQTEQMYLNMEAT